VDEALKAPAISKLGDVWLLGKHRLVCSDSNDPAVFSVLMDGKKANLCVTDPPYSVGYFAKAGSIKNDNLNDEDFYKFLLHFIRIPLRLWKRMHPFMCFIRIHKGLTLEMLLKGQAFICLVYACGQSSPLCLEEVRISGNMSRSRMDDVKMIVNTIGMLIVSNLPFGSLIALRRMNCIRQ